MFFFVVENSFVTYAVKEVLGRAVAYGLKEGPLK